MIELYIVVQGLLALAGLAAFVSVVRSVRDEDWVVKALVYLMATAVFGIGALALASEFIESLKEYQALNLFLEYAK